MSTTTQQEVSNHSDNRQLCKHKHQETNIVLKKNVRVISGPKSLSTDQAILDLGKAILIVKGHFVLEAPEKEIMGEYLATDIFLNLIRAQ